MIKIFVVICNTKLPCCSANLSPRQRAAQQNAIRCCDNAVNGRNKIMDRRKNKRQKVVHHSFQEESSIIQFFPDQDVPVDIYRLIFEYLAGYPTENCMQVSKQWRAHFLQFVPKAFVQSLPRRKLSKQFAESIRCLNIDSYEFNWLDRTTLLNFKLLRELDISIHVVSSTCKTIAKLTQLVSLSIDSTHHNNATFILGKLTGLKQFKVVLTDDQDIHRRYKVDEGEEEEDLGVDPAICDCNKHEKTAYTIEFFEALAKMTRLESLTLHSRHLPMLPRHLSSLTLLTSLGLNGQRVPPCYPRHFSTLTNIEYLYSINNIKNSFTAQQIQKHFAPFVKLTALSSPFYFNRAHNEEILDTEFFQHLTRLRYINLSTDLRPFTLRSVKHLKIKLPSDRVSNIATMTNLTFLSISIMTPPYNVFWQLTTLTNLQCLEYFGKHDEDKDYQGKWHMICEYAKKMTRLSAVHFSPPFTMKREPLPYSWQRTDNIGLM